MESNFNQHWRKEDAGGGAFKITKKSASGFAIDGGSNGGNGQNVALYDSSNSSQNLQWFITPIGTSAKSIEGTGDQIILFPNPVESIVTIEGAANATMSIFDINGKILDAITISNESEVIDLSALQAGLYYAQIQTQNALHVKEILKK